MVLQVRDDSLLCTAALPSAPSDTSFPIGEFLQAVLLGRVCALDAGQDCSDLPPDLVAPAHAALFLPIGLTEQRAVLLLSRAKDAGGFGPDDVDLTRQCAVVSLAALVVHGGTPREPNRRLNALLAESRDNEDHARQDNGCSRKSSTTCQLR
jgi:hypothetical protein